MGCESCGVGADGVPKGCGSKGSCLTGGCNKRNTYDWLSQDEIHDPTGKHIVEISFQNGARKDFYRLRYPQQCITGDVVAVDTTAGYDIGTVSLSGALVSLQMRKKRVKEDEVRYDVLRIANHRDLERLKESRSKEKETLIKARAISRMLMLDMKIGDVEYQGDGRKITIYYTAEGRVDFRELVREYARKFKAKVEMRQIGARQESQRVGGIGSCGRELCCSTWLSSFKSVSTAAARYQNLSINQTKLSGQCGRLKCCLNYELETYIDALKSFPKNVNHVFTEKGKAIMIKMDIFKGLMHFAYLDKGRLSGFTAVPKERVWDIIKLNKAGENPPNLLSEEHIEEIAEVGWADVTGEIEVNIDLKKKRRPKNKRRKPQNKNKSTGGDLGGNARSNKPGQNKKKSEQSGASDSKAEKKDQNSQGKSSKSNNKNKRRYKKRPSKNKPNQSGSQQSSGDQ